MGKQTNKDLAFTLFIFTLSPLILIEINHYRFTSPSLSLTLSSLIFLPSQISLPQTLLPSSLYHYHHSADPALPLMISTVRNLSFELSEGFMIVFFRMATGCNFNTMQSEFNRDDTVIGQIFNTTISIIKKYWLPLIEPTLPSNAGINSTFIRWAPKLDEFAEAIEAKTGALNSYPAPAGLFIDGTFIAIERPDATINPLADRATYSGYKKKHGLNFQVVSAPNGMYVHVYGGVGAQWSDRTMRNWSYIDGQMQNLQAAANPPSLVSIYGDSAYTPVTNQIFSAHIHPNQTVQERYETHMISTERATIENLFANTKALLWFLPTEQRKSKLYESSCGIDNIFKCSLLFTNWYNCFHGNQVSSRYNGQYPDIYSYNVGGVD